MVVHSSLGSAVLPADEWLQRMLPLCSLADQTAVVGTAVGVEACGKRLPASEPRLKAAGSLPNWCWVRLRIPHLGLLLAVLQLEVASAERHSHFEESVVLPAVAPADTAAIQLLCR